MEQLHNKNHYTFRNANLHKKIGFQPRRIKTAMWKIHEIYLFIIIYQPFTTTKNYDLDANDDMNILCNLRRKRFHQKGTRHIYTRSRGDVRLYFSPSLKKA